MSEVAHGRDRARVTPYRSPFLGRPGAVVGAGPDAGVALHYGDPSGEQRALEAGNAVVDLSHLGVVTVAGADRLTWLHSLCTQDLLALSPGESREVLVLDPHGHVEHAAALIDDGTTTWLVTEAAAAPRLVAFLDRMRFTLRVEVSDASADTAVVGTVLPAATVACPSALARLSAAAGDTGGATPHATSGATGRSPGESALVWRDPWPLVGPGGAAYGPADADHPGREYRFALVLLPRADLEPVLARVEAAGVVLAGTWAWEAVRVAAYRPRPGREVDDRTLPHELDWLRTGVHLTKGCYRGQETVARVVNLGRPPRRLVLLHLDGSEHVLPDAGSAVRLGEREVGRVTTVARHRELGPIALAVLRRSVPADAGLSVAGVAAAQEVVVRPEGTSDARPPERSDLPQVRALRRPSLD